MRECLDKVADRDLQSGAQCIVNAWNSKFTRRIGKLKFWHFCVLSTFNFVVGL
jgi:hypothetical protein